MNKKAQNPGQMLMYITTIIVAGLIIVFGYRAIAGITEKSEQATYIKLKSDLENSIKRTASDYGSVYVKELTIPGDFLQVCFVDNKLIDNKDSAGETRDYPIIYDSVTSGVKKNVFLMPDGSESIYVGKIDADENGKDFFCIDVTRRKIRLKLEGLGDSTKITPYEGAMDDEELEE